MRISLDEDNKENSSHKHRAPLPASSQPSAADVSADSNVETAASASGADSSGRAAKKGGEVVALEKEGSTLQDAFLDYKKRRGQAKKREESVHIHAY